MLSFISLLKYDLLNSYKINKIFKKQHERGNLKLISYLVIICYFLYIIFKYINNIDQTLINLGLSKVIISQGIVISVIFIATTSIFKIPYTLFGIKDYDILISMPIKKYKIVLVKLINILLPTYCIMFVFMIPSLIVYYINTNSSNMFLVMGFVLTLFIPLIPVAIVTLIGTMIIYFTSKLKHRNLITTVVFFILIFFILIGEIMGHKFMLYIINSPNLYNTLMYFSYPLANLYVSALIDNNYSDMIMFIFISITIFFIFILILEKLFFIINSKLLECNIKNNYKVGNIYENSISKALLIKEVKTKLSIPIVALNSLLFPIMYLILGIVTLIYRRGLLRNVLGMSDLSSNITIIIIMLIGITLIFLENTTSYSFSLEGRNLWQLKVLPINSLDIFKAKIYIDMMIMTPTVIISTLLITFGLELNIFYSLFVIIIQIIWCFLIPTIGLIVNLKYLDTKWESEAVIVKRSLSVNIIKLGGIIIVGCLFYAYLYININMYLVCFLIASIALSIICIYILKVWGENRLYSEEFEND